jgi:integrase
VFILIALSRGERVRPFFRITNLPICYLLAAARLRKKRIIKALGKVDGPGETLNPFQFHSLRRTVDRRTATTILHETGVPAAVARALIGHGSEAMMHQLYDYLRIARQPTNS